MGIVIGRSRLDSLRATCEMDDRHDHKDEDERAKTDIHMNLPFEVTTVADDAAKRVVL